jgi:pyruvate/2-oxoglutarate dehydrogenase complex dihydrolipoamide acyltransferase (E2) component
MRARPLLLVPLAALVAALAAAAPAGSPKPDDPETARLRGQVERLRRERDLASGKTFYLRLDAGDGRLALVLQGVALDDYRTESVEWGVPEVLFVDRAPGADWDAAAFSKGRLEPERERDRVEVVAPAPAPTGAAAPGPAPAETPSPSPPPVPKSAEESYSVPSPYRILFAEGIALEVRAKGHGGRNRSLFQRLADAVGLRLSDLGTALGLGAKERVRLRVTLEAEDAASLYRSLPPDVGLVVVGLPSR